MKQFAMASAGALILAACGGGGSSDSGGSATPTPPNSAPSASAGSDITTSLAGEGIQLDGSGSTDPDGDALSYGWTITAQPSGAGASLTDANTARPRLMTLAPGDYAIELTVNDGKGGSSRDTVNLTLTNDAPQLVIDPTPSQTAVGLPVTLDASGSSDSNGHPLSYTWALVSAPSGSLLRETYSGPAHTVEFDLAGTYTFELVIDDGYEQVSSTVSVSVSTYTQYELAHGFDYLAASASGELIVSSRENIVRVVGEDGSSTHSFTLPAIVLTLATSPNGQWIAAGHQDRISFIDMSNANQVVTWSVASEPGDLVVDNQGVAHFIPRIDQWENLHSVDPATGVETISTGTVRAGTRMQIHPNGMKAYGANRGLSPSDLERYDIVNGVANIVYDTPYHGDFPFCGDLWIADSGMEILSACGVVVRATDDPATDLTYRTQLDRTGLILDAEQQGETGYWYVIEQGTGSSVLNVYDGVGGQWIQTLQLPDILPGRPATPLRVAIGDDEFIRIYAADHPTNPQSYAVFTRAMVDQSNLNNPPVTIVANSGAGRIRQPVRLDASNSYDPEGEALGFSWALVGQPQGSALSLNHADQDELTFTPIIEGLYTFSLEVSDGEKSAPAQTIEVHVVGATEALQVRLSGQPTDIIYNKVRNQILYVQSDSSLLRIRDLTDFTEQLVTLPQPGFAVDVSPNGAYAAVSHKGLVSLISLRENGAEVTDTQTVDADWGDVVIDNNRVAYTVPIRDQWVGFVAADFLANTAYTRWGARAGTQLRMRPSGGAVYAANRGLSPSDIERYSVSNLDQIGRLDSPYHGTYAMSGNLWISEGSSRILVAGGHVFRASDDPSFDMTYVESLSPRQTILWADHSGEASRWATVSNNQLRLYNDTTYLESTVVDVAPLYFDSAGASPRLDQVFYSDDGAALIVVAHADGATEDTHAIQIIQ